MSLKNYVKTIAALVSLCTVAVAASEYKVLIPFKDLRAAYRAPVNITIDSSRNSYNLAVALGNRTGPQDITVTINSGVEIYAASPAVPAFTTGLLPEGSVVTIINNGTIRGAGGKGGKSAYFVHPNNPVRVDGEAGQNGGTAIVLTVPTTINTQYGSILGGGGGGGGGGAASNGAIYDGGGGGGGAGVVNAAGGLSASSTCNANCYNHHAGIKGAAGSSLAGGSGGKAGVAPTAPSTHYGGAGGHGGAPGMPGSAGAPASTKVSWMFTVAPGPGGAAGSAISGAAFLTLTGNTGSNVVGPIN